MRKESIEVSLLPQQSTKVAVSIFGTCATEIELNSRWGKFVTILKEVGVNLVPIIQQDINFFVSVDYSQKHFDLVTRRSKVGRRVLVAIEPPSINPAQFRFENYAKFDFVITTPTLVSFFPKAIAWTPGFVEKDYQPVAIDVTEFNSRPINFGLLSSNKYSPFKSSQYELRKEIIRDFARSNILVTIAGSDWKRSKYWNLIQFLKVTILNFRYLSKENFHFAASLFHLRHADYKYVGKIARAYDFYHKVKFALCIESDMNDFSEKLFEVISAGAIPLYVGPVELEKLGIPSNAFVRMPARSEEFIVKAIEISTNPEFNRILSSNSEWLLNWKTEESFRVLYQIIFKDTEAN